MSPDRRTSRSERQSTGVGLWCLVGLVVLVCGRVVQFTAPSAAQAPTDEGRAQAGTLTPGVDPRCEAEVGGPYDLLPGDRFHVHDLPNGTLGTMRMHTPHCPEPVEGSGCDSPPPNPNRRVPLNTLYVVWLPGCDETTNPRPQPIALDGGEWDYVARQSGCLKLFAGYDPPCDDPTASCAGVEVPNIPYCVGRRTERGPTTHPRCLGGPE